MLAVTHQVHGLSVLAVPASFFMSLLDRIAHLPGRSIVLGHEEMLQIVETEAFVRHIFCWGHSTRCGRTHLSGPLFFLSADFWLGVLQAVSRETVF